MNAETPKSKSPVRAQLRTQGRELALQLLYSFEQNKYIDDGALLIDDSAEDNAEGSDPEALGLAKELLAGFAKERVAVDAAIDKRLENWTIHRLAVLDRALLRLGTYELIYRLDTPPKVAINECIELAKRFGSEAKTPGLVNGVLDKIAREHRAGEVGSKKG